MNIIMPIYIINNTFAIERSEEIGYVQHYFDYDKHKIHLINIERISGNSEGDSSTVKYNFQILTNESSEIVFIDNTCQSINNVKSTERTVPTTYLIEPKSSRVYLKSGNNSCIIV